MKNIHINNDDNYATPPDFYEALNSKFNFNFDPCPYNENEIIVDGLTVEWGGKLCKSSIQQKIKRWIY